MFKIGNKQYKTFSQAVLAAYKMGMKEVEISEELFKQVDQDTQSLAMVALEVERTIRQQAMY